MKFTLLLDLDDTLLESNIEQFIPAYFLSLAETLKDCVSPDVMLPALMSGTRRMLAKVDPANTLQQVFEEYFFPKIDIEKAYLETRIDYFYDSVFPNLGSLTRQKPQAIAFTNWAFQQGYDIAIATNPLFPLKAITNRLRWAGLSPEVYPFKLITSFETSHFTKENIAYFPEILGKLGWLDQPVLMVGNDLEMDIKPAIKAGLPVFWLNGKSAREGSEIPSGDFSDLQAFLMKSNPGDLHYSLNKPSAIFAELRAMPAILSTYFNSSKDSTFAAIVNNLMVEEGKFHHSLIRERIGKDHLKSNNDFTSPDLASLSSHQPNPLSDFIQTRKETISLLENSPDHWHFRFCHPDLGECSFLESAHWLAKKDIATIQSLN